MEKIGVEFKHLISYIIPGVFALFSIEYRYDLLKYGDKYKIYENESSIILLLLIAAGLGMIINVVTWNVVRPIVELTGVKKPELNYGNLKSDKIEIYNNIIESSFSYYQSYSNMLTVLLLFMLCYLTSTDRIRVEILIILIIIILMLFIGARDSLKRSYTRMNALLSG